MSGTLLYKYNYGFHNKTCYSYYEIMTDTANCLLTILLSLFFFFFNTNRSLIFLEVTTSPAKTLASQDALATYSRYCYLKFVKNHWDFRTIFEKNIDHEYVSSGLCPLFLSGIKIGFHLPLERMNARWEGWQSRTVRSLCPHWPLSYFKALVPGF